VCGLIGVAGIPDLKLEIGGLLERLAHRGPDAAGIFETGQNDQYVKLGHRRLSIIDLSDAANQPFQKGNLVILFNGEIYNFRTLRAEIEATGVQFRTNSDTEVILEAWRLWGPQSFIRLRGMFAIAIYDKRERRLILAGSVWNKATIRFPPWKWAGICLRTEGSPSHSWCGCRDR